MIVVIVVVNIGKCGEFLKGFNRNDLEICKLVIFEFGVISFAEDDDDNRGLGIFYMIYWILYDLTST